MNLIRSGLQTWQGLLFAGDRDVNSDLAGMQAVRDLDFSGFELDSVQGSSGPPPLTLKQRPDPIHLGAQSLPPC